MLRKHIEITPPSISGTYAYDSQGRRISKTAGGTTTTYGYDGAHVIAEYDASDTLLRKFIYGPAIDEPICMIVDGGARYWYHAACPGTDLAGNASGSVVALSNDSGGIVERYEYDAYGQTVFCDASGNEVASRTKSIVGNPYLFTGRRYDEESSLYYYRARMYKPEIGRFLQPDPIGYKDSMNLYLYVGNNPLNRLDRWDWLPTRGVRTGICLHVNSLMKQ